MHKVEYVLSALAKIEQTVVRVIDNSEAINQQSPIVINRAKRINP